MSLPVTIITDCRDANALERVRRRVLALFPEANIGLVGVSNDLEASGCLVDVLDSALGTPGIILVNVAPRSGKGGKHTNGSPFGYVRLEHSGIYTTIDGFTPSMLKKFWPAISITEYDVANTAPYFKISEDRVKSIIESQFRSYEYLPLLADLIENQKVTPKGVVKQIGEFPDAPAGVWYIDCFGNAKTTYLASEKCFTPNQTLHLRADGNSLLLRYYQTLKDVPVGEVALIAGSSGYGQQRFMEVVVRGGSAAREYSLHVGQNLVIVE